MSDIATKLEYLGTTKTQLKGMINYGLDENNKITNETTFRDYVKSIFKAFLESLNNPDTLFTNLPKKSGTGVNITLNDAANAPMRIELGASEISQSGTPTPESPQNIHTISGDNTLMVEGKNLWNENAQVFTNQALLSNPTKDSNNVWTFTSSGSGYAFAISKKTLQAGTYTFSFNCVGGNAIVLNGSTTLNNTFTLNGETEITIRVFKSGAVEGDVIKLSNVMIEKGSTATPYEPYVSQEADINLGDIEYCKTGNYEDEFIRTSGLNKLPNNTTTQTISNVTFTKEDGGSIKLSGTSNSYADFYFVGSASQYIDLGLEAGTYNLNGCTGGSGTTYMLYAVQNRNGTLYYYQNYTSEGINISIQDGDTFRIFIRVMSGQTVNNVTIYPMLNEGTTALPYEPYGSNEWYIKKSIGKVVLDGSEMWGYGGITSVFYTTSITDYAISNNIPYSNYYKGVNNVIGAGSMGTQNNNTISFINQSGQTTPRFYIKDTSYINQDPNDLKTWLASNNLIVYYPLATPTYTQITGTLVEQLENIYQKLKSYKGTTNISQVNNDLPFIMNIQALEDLE